MRERIIILGAGVMQGPAIRIAKELGFFTVVVDGSANAPCISLADKFEQIDLKDKEGIEAFARSLRDSGGGLGGIMTAGTDFSASVAWVAERLGLPGIPYEAALNASDKARMRACFKTAGLPSPEFTVITEADLPNCQLPATNYQLVIKPVDNMGGRGCRRIDSMAEFHAAAADALSFSRSGRAIVETFMDGPEFSVDAIVYHGEITICGLADRHIFFPPYFIEMGHTMPTAISGERQQAILETFCAGIRALGLAGEGSIGAAKGDIKLTANGPMIGEIAARLSGGYMSGWTYPYSSGVEPIRAAILAAMGRGPDGLVPLKKWTSAERAFISIPGTIKTISGIEAARSLPYVQDMFLRIATGSKVSFPENNVSKCGNVISAAPEREAAINAAENAVRSVLIRLEPDDQQTAAFLSHSHPSTPLDGALCLPRRARPPEGGLPSPDAADSSCAGTCDIYSSTPLDGALCRFPPSAFQTTAEMLAALEKLPETSGAGDMGIIPFPEFAESGLRDYVGRSVGESLEAVRTLTGFSLPETPESSDNNRGASKTQPVFGFSGTLLGRSFWAALIRGGYQGAVYYIDQLRQ